MRKEPDASHRGHRRSIRIRGMHYAEAGAYFVTICADRRRSIFGRIEPGKVVLTRLGEIVRGCWVRIPGHFAKAEMREFVVMPNHVHGIIVLKAAPVGVRYIVPCGEKARTPEAFQKPVKGSIPTIMRAFKAEVTRQAARELKWQGPVWQRNYYEHVLRDEAEYLHARSYILENPKRWEWDEENPHAKREPSGSALGKTR